MGPSLNPPPRSEDAAGSQPIMTFRPPGATPVSIGAEAGSQPAKEKKSAAPAKGQPGSSKVAFIVVGMLVLAGLGVATGWFLTR
jgi:hypothetical protein